MPQDISIANDLKTAAVLAGSARLLGAVTVPFLLPSISELAPPDQRTPPLPLFCVILAVQFLVIYGLLALAGLRLGRARNREPAPLLTALWANKRPDRFVWSAAGASRSTRLWTAPFSASGVVERPPPPSRSSARYQLACGSFRWPASVSGETPPAHPGPSFS
jgi:hypothetical protein